VRLVIRHARPRKSGWRTIQGFFARSTLRKASWFAISDSSSFLETTRAYYFLTTLLEIAVTPATQAPRTCRFLLIDLWDVMTYKVTIIRCSGKNDGPDHEPIRFATELAGKLRPAHATFAVPWSRFTPVPVGLPDVSKLQCSCARAVEARKCKSFNTRALA